MLTSGATNRQQMMDLPAKSMRAGKSRRTRRKSHL
jgi:hypothetical protein